MESDASVHNRVEDVCARDCRRTPKALFQFEQALLLLLQSGTVFRGIMEITEPCLFQWRQHNYNVLLKAYEFEGETNHLPYRSHKEKGMLVCMRRGAKPAELPVVQAVKVELVLNLKTANTLALKFPLTLARSRRPSNRIGGRHQAKLAHSGCVGYDV
jgi:hypothetical protein